MSSSVYRHQHRVTYAECTAGNHIYYGRYLNILEEARGEFFRHLGQTFLHWQEKDAIFPVVECRLRYRGPARYDDVLTVEVWLTDMEKVRLNFAYRVLDLDDRLLLEASTFHVCTSLQEKIKRLPEELRNVLQPYIRTGAAPQLKAVSVAKE